jgi:hypothetical protein
MKIVCRLLVVGVFLLVFGTTVARSVSAGGIALSEVPKNLLAAAQEAVPGLRLTEAEVEKTHKGLVYELEGTADGKEYEIKVLASGKVLKVEEEDHGYDHHSHDHHCHD